MKKNGIKFSLITPSYERPTALATAVESVLAQAYPDWEMIIVIDSPGFTGYHELKKQYQDNRLRFLENEENLGANASRNRGLEATASDSGRIVFLDDDDWLAPEALEKLAKMINEHPDEKWLLTNRSAIDGSFKTHAPKDRRQYHYARDYLIQKKISGDATHCIDTKEATAQRFPTSVKNGEEWLYFFSLGLKLEPFYIDLDTTMTSGYTPEGLNFRRRNTKAQLKMLPLLLKEAKNRGFKFNPYFIFYLTMRGLRAFIK